MTFQRAQPTKTCKIGWDGRMRRATKPFAFDDIRAAARKEYKKRRRDRKAYGIFTWNIYYQAVLVYGILTHEDIHANQEKGTSAETDYCDTLFESLAEDRIDSIKYASHLLDLSSSGNIVRGVDLASEEDRTSTVIIENGEIVSETVKKRGAPPKRGSGSRFVASQEEYTVTSPESSTVPARVRTPRKRAGIDVTPATVEPVDGRDNTKRTGNSPRVPRKSKTVTD